MKTLKEFILACTKDYKNHKYGSKQATVCETNDFKQTRKKMVLNLELRSHVILF